jgi:hypothetical protein
MMLSSAVKPILVIFHPESVSAAHQISSTSLLNNQAAILTGGLIV